MAKVRWGAFTIDSDVVEDLDKIIDEEQKKDKAKNERVRSRSAIAETLLRKLIRDYRETARV